jgi:peroxiredoxin
MGIEATKSKTAKEPKMLRLHPRYVIFALAIVLGLSAMGFSQKAAPGPAEFSLRSVDGQTITSDSLKGEVVVLAFGASWLPLSRAQLQGVKKLADEYANRGVVVYWVSTESENPKSKNYASDDQLRAFARKYGLNVTVLRDPDGAVSKKLGADELPSVVILDKEGRSVGEPLKGLNPDGNLAGQLAKQLDSIL